MSHFIAEFIDGRLTHELPPKSPLIRSDWSALAFDRNLYETFAPANVWSAWFDCHARTSHDPGAIAVVSFAERGSKDDMRTIPPSLASLQKYWDEDARFLSDHFVVSPNPEWIVRLDQDVTLFAGQQAFVACVLSQLGGKEQAMAVMEDDFRPGEGDHAGLREYLRSLLRNQ